MKKVFLLLALCPAFSGYLFAQASADAQTFAASITSAELKSYVYTLAGEDFEGRETGKLGQKKCAEFLQDEFVQLGLPPVIENVGYLQVFPLKEEYTGTVVFNANGQSYSFMKDFYCFSNVNDLDLNFNSLVFAGFGIKEDAAGYNDYRNLDVKGKIVLILEDEPIDKAGISRISKTARLSEWTSDFRKKAELARDMGAVAVVEIAKNLENDVEKYGHWLEKPRTMHAEDQRPETFPVFYISKEMASSLFTSYNTKYSYEYLREQYRKKAKTFSFEFPVSGNIQVQRKRVQITGENVLGYIEGTDLKDELVIITAHYDHLGKQGDEIYYGADDDGSGTAAILEIAEAFALAKKAGKGPRRSILIMPVSGEEKGLLGSEYYVKHPVFPLKKTVCNLNIDMIGRMDEDHENDTNYVYIIGSDKLSSELHAANENNNSAYTKIDLDYTYNDEKDKNRFYYRSDHYNFAKNGIPVIFYFTGVHQDYHKPTDTPDKLHYGKMETITRLVFYTAWDVANRDKRLPVDSNKK